MIRGRVEHPASYIKNFYIIDILSKLKDNALYPYSLYTRHKRYLYSSYIRLYSVPLYSILSIHDIIDIYMNYTYYTQRLIQYHLFYIYILYLYIIEGKGKRVYSKIVWPHFCIWTSHLIGALDSETFEI